MKKLIIIFRPIINKITKLMGDCTHHCLDSASFYWFVSIKQGSNTYVTLTSVNEPAAENQSRIKKFLNLQGLQSSLCNPLQFTKYDKNMHRKKINIR